MRHTLIVIGWIGDKRAYLDVTREEAIRRFTESEEVAPKDDEIGEFTFTDEFNVYDAWGNDPT